MSSVALIDAHVHIHNCFKLRQLLDSARENFCRAQPLHPENCLGVLIITDIGPRSWFQELSQNLFTCDASTSCRVGEQWLITRTQESYSLMAQHCQGQKMILLLGRQIVTQEGVEILALITENDFPDHLPLEITVQSILSAQALPVLPWGVGKWIGPRGSYIQRFLDTHYASHIFLGDNSGRPSFWPRPSHFKQAELKGVRILPGTDPLPLENEYRRPGSFGFKLLCSLDQNSPGEDLKRLLLNPSTVIQPYGDLENPLRFLRNQWMLRFK
ncbi:hypothetical protein XM38_041460 [Halomicronema hongdechloris C2206]|uniref:Uncharacterized protein n=1 Tax=Halomicronema hongdechloris C2206 TaxID=1641165 RepID=A0A1Z3HS95_9CYAN|nr:hypothetical protein [Halomicronema hongdechloris]ASC73184.1 hypothetical protein XM38_041460 [Halomicronema hongdechloris C2206]